MVVVLETVEEGVEADVASVETNEEELALALVFNVVVVAVVVVVVVVDVLVDKVLLLLTHTVVWSLQQSP